MLIENVLDDEERAMILSISEKDFKRISGQLSKKEILNDALNMHLLTQQLIKQIQCIEMVQNAYVSEYGIEIEDGVTVRIK